MGKLLKQKPMLEMWPKPPWTFMWIFYSHRSHKLMGVMWNESLLNGILWWKAWSLETIFEWLYKQVSRLCQLKIKTIHSLNRSDLSNESATKCKQMTFSILASVCKGWYTRGVLLRGHAPGSFCTCQYTRGAFSSSLNLPRELAPKYLTG